MLLIPGAETKGFSFSRRRASRGVEAARRRSSPTWFAARGGLMFLSHLEERMDWEIRGLTGSEIYNTHADFKDEKKLIAALRNPLWLVTRPSCSASIRRRRLRRCRTTRPIT